MARMTPFALAQTERPTIAPARKRDDSKATIARRVERIRKEDRWADETIHRNVRSTMQGRYGVRM